VVEAISAHCQRLEFPSHTFPPFTHTNSYLIYSDGRAALVDPGFYEQDSLETFLKTLETTNLKTILLTHTHPDHQEGIALIETLFPEIPVYVHPLEYHRVKAKNICGFAKTVAVGSLQLEVLFTPGHSPGHVSFYLPQDKVALVGDMVAGYGSTWIGLPDGNYNHYFASLEKLKALKCSVLAPGHGPVIFTPDEKLEEVKAHRLKRLEQVYKALEHPLNLQALGLEVYPNVDPEVQSAIEGSLLALLEKLEDDGLVENIGQDRQGPFQAKRL
jgi:endoribonuclease LACTB2